MDMRDILAFLHWIMFLQIILEFILSSVVRIVTYFLFLNCYLKLQLKF